MLITTSICGNYLPKAMVMSRSVKRTNPDCRIVVCLLEDEIPPAARQFPYFDDIVLAKHIGIPDFERFIFKYSIVEASTAVKGQLFIYLMERYPEMNNFVYLDPDITVYDELSELKQALDEKPIVLTPHLSIPKNTPETVRDLELGALQHGVFNLGFAGVSRSTEAERFVRWWASRLFMYCYDDAPRGIFTDQRWIDLALGFFDIYILKHPGYNVAPWNLSRRHLTFEKNRYFVNGEPLRFVHFSGIDSSSNLRMINRYMRNKNSAIFELRKQYIRDLDEMGQKTLGRMRWYYGSFRTGEPIDPSARLAFRSLPGADTRIGNPFERSNSYFYKYDNFKHSYNTAVNTLKLVWSRIAGN